MAIFTRIGLLLLIIASWCTQAKAQNLVMAPGTVNACGGFFVDSGGQSGGYGPNEDITMTICALPNSTDTHVQLFFPSVDLREDDEICFFDGTSTAASPLGCSGDFLGDPFIIQATAANTTGCVTITFVSDGQDQGLGWSAQLTCTTACQTIGAELAMANPVVSPADTGWIDICPGDRVQLTAQGLYPQNGIIYQHSDFTSSFAWDFGDGTTSVGPNASHRYDNPGGYIVQVTITDQFGCRNTNFITQRVRVSTYPEYDFGDLPSDICVGDTLSLTATVDTMMAGVDIAAMSTEGFFQQGGSRSDTLMLPDGGGVSYSTSIALTQFRPGAVLTNVNDITGVCLMLEHSYGGDLDIEIICPNGQSAYILDYPSGVGSTNFGEPFASAAIDFVSTDLTPGIPYSYCFRMFDTDFGTLPQMAQANTYTYTTVPNASGTTYTYTDRYFPAGTYLPQQSFNNLLGCPLNGEWTIRVQDNLGLDNGWLFEWGIDFAPQLFAVLETFTPTITDWGWIDNPTITYMAQDSIDAAPINAGTANYTFFVENDFGCTFDTSISVTVLPVTHPDCYNCADNLTEVPDTTICVGQSVLMDVSSEVGLSQEVTFEVRPNHQYSFLTNPYSSPYRSRIAVNSISPGTLTNPAAQIESVCININTLWVGDLRVFLRSPAGALLELTTNNGGNGDNYTNTCFSPLATNPITAGTAPFTGVFRPEGNWAVLNGGPINGNWDLLVSDGFGVNDINTLVSWTITFQSTNQISYTWSPATNLSCNNCATPTATPTTTRTYTVTSTDSYGCIYSDEVTITVLNSIPPVTNLVCGTPEPGVLLFEWDELAELSSYEYRITLNGVTGPWTGPVTDLSAAVDGLLNGDEVTIEVRGFLGSSALACDVESAFTTCVYESCDLTLTPLVITDVLATPALCNGGTSGTATAVVTGGIGAYTYQWSDPLQQISPTANFLAAGQYQVTVRDEVGCIRTATVTVPEPAELTASATTTPASCFDGSDGTATVAPAGGTSPYAYAWANGQTTQVSTGYTAGAHVVSVTDNNGCTTTAIATVAQPDTPVSVTAVQALRGCVGTQTNQATATAVGGTGSSYTYVWSNGQNGSAIGSLPPGAVTVVATDANGCTAEATAELIDLEPIVLNIIIGPASCFGLNDGQMGINAVSGGAGDPNNISTYTFNWSSGQVGATANNLAGDQVYEVTVTDQQGCTGTESRFLPQPLPITFSVQHTDASCFGGTDGTASVSNIAGSQVLFTFAWSSNAGNQTTATAQNLSAGTYGVTVTDVTGCFVGQTVEVEQPTAVEVQSVVEDVQCFGEAQGKVELKPSGGTPGYTYLWPNGGTALGQQNLIAGTYNVTVTDANACEHIIPVLVEEPDMLVAEIVPQGVTCYSDKDGRISIMPQGGTPPYRYSLDNQNFDGASQRIGLAAGDYNVFVRDAYGCMFFTETVVDEPEEFVVDAGLDYTMDLGDSLRVYADSRGGAGQITYIWSAPYDGTLSCTECAAPFVGPTYSITYELYGMDENGCESTDLVNVFVRKPRMVAVPTGFTPNSDGNNDRLLVHGREGTRVKLFQVFDRWGELVYEGRDFEVNDTNTGWDGTFRGQDMNGGVYVWLVTAIYPIDEEEETFRGQTTLIR